MNTNELLFNELAKHALPLYQSAGMLADALLKLNIGCPEAASIITSLSRLSIQPLEGLPEEMAKVSQWYGGLNQALANQTESISSECFENFMQANQKFVILLTQFYEKANSLNKICNDS